MIQVYQEGYKGANNKRLVDQQPFTTTNVDRVLDAIALFVLQFTDIFICVSDCFC